MEDIFEIISKLKKENKEAFLITVIKTKGTTSSRVGAKMVILSDNTFFGTIGGGEVEFEIRNLISQGKIKKATVMAFNLTPKKIEESEKGHEIINLNSMCSGYVELFVEPIHSEETLYIIGGGHCAVELSPLAQKCGFHVVVIDHRREWASREKHPLAHQLIVANYEEVDKYIEFSQKSYVAVMTPRHEFDELVISKLAGKNLKYLGFMGSPHKVKETFKHLMERGFKEEILKKIYAPIGISIKSNTPTEIAISIMAQILAIKNNLEEIEFSGNPLLKKKKNNILC